MLEYLHLNLFEEGKEKKEIIVQPSESIKVLTQMIDENDKRFVYYRGFFLNTAFSFKFYHIKDGDNIYILKSLSKNNIKVQNKIEQDLNTSSIYLEISRLNDIKYTQIDRFNIKNKKKQNVKNLFSNFEKDLIFNINFEPLKAPSTSVLPKCWAN